MLLFILVVEFSVVWCQTHGRMDLTFDKDKSDLVIQGAVVLGCGGGGPLHFARQILSGMERPARVTPMKEIHGDEWLAMTALIGTPSKVHTDTGSRESSGEDVVDGPLPDNKGSHTFSRVARIIAERISFHTRCPKSQSFDEVDGNHKTCRDKRATSLLTPNVAASNTLRYLEKQCRLRSVDSEDFPRFKNFKEITHLLTGELGAVNIAVALYLSSTSGKSVADCDGAGRAVPLVEQITYADRFNSSPTVIVSPKESNDLESIPSVLLDLPFGAESTIQKIVGDLFSLEGRPFSPFMGYGSYVVTGSEVKGVAVENSYSIAYEIGKVLDRTEGKERAQNVCGALNTYGKKCEVVFHGFVTRKHLRPDEIVHDIGHIRLQGEQGDEMILWYKNEIMMAGRPGEDPKYLAPDLICIVPARGPPVDISSIQHPLSGYGDEVYVIAVEGDSRLKTDKKLESFEIIYKLFKDDEGKDIYQGKYVSWLPGNGY